MSVRHAEQQGIRYCKRNTYVKMTST